MKEYDELYRKRDTDLEKYFELNIKENSNF
jgi:hypothetical protein